MIIEVESFYGDCYLWGKKTAISELKKQMNNILSTVCEEEFVSSFCSRYKYERIEPAGFCVADFVIDLDTHMVYESHKARNCNYLQKE